MKNRFTPETAAMLLIDHQEGTMSHVGSMPFEDMKKNTLMLAKAARALNMPVVLTSSMEDHAQGPLLPELQSILPEAFAARVARGGRVNAMDDDNFAKAVSALGRKRLIVAGVTNDVCTVFPVLSLREQGYEVYVVADAGGSPSKVGDDLSLRRMEQAGAVIVGVNQLIAELAYDWTGPNGQKLMGVVAEAMQG